MEQPIQELLLEPVIVLCRTCGNPTPTQSCISFKSVEANNLCILNDLEVLGLRIDHQDMLPKYICRLCTEKVKQAVDFINEMLLVQKRLLKTVATAAEQNDMDIKEETYAVDVVDIKDMLEIKPIDESDLYSIKSETKYDTKLSKKPKSGTESDHSFAESNHHNSSSEDEKPLKLQQKKKTVKLKTKKLKAKERVVKLQEVKRRRKIRKPKITELTGDDNALKAREALLYADQTWADYTWECNECSAQFLNAIQLRQHCKNVHNRCCTYKCIDCVVLRPPFFKVEQFTAHASRHRQSLKTCCFYCNKISSTIALNTSHKMLKHGEFVCVICGEEFDNEMNYNEHKGGYALRNSERKCTECDKICKIGKPFTEHMKVHKAKEIFCDQCGKAFHYLSELNIHRESHTNVKLYECTICNTKLKSKSSLYSHNTKVHEEKKIECDVCGRMFKHKDGLRDHMKTHSDVADFECLYCEKRFKRKTNLDVHLRQHTGEKPYICVKCNRRFTNSANYGKHMKRKHGDATDRSKRRVFQNYVEVKSPDSQYDPVNLHTALINPQNNLINPHYFTHIPDKM